MATKETGSPTKDVPELQAAAALMLQREEKRQRTARIRAKRRRRERRQEERKAIQKMHHSVEVIKWCIVGICTVWVISFLISIFVLIKVQSKVAEIEGEVQRIRYVMDNPFASAGERLGGQVDARLREFFRIPDAQDNEQ